jgi:4-hydroxybenzoyl-CoA thioesterase
MIVYERRVRFDDVDAAGLVFYARMLGYCHEAMEVFFGSLEGGYVALINTRRVGFPTVHIEADFRAPVRYGDALRIVVETAHIGTRSASLRFTMTRVADGVMAAVVKNVYAVSNLDALKAISIPDDVRTALAAHLPA